MNNYFMFCFFSKAYCFTTSTKEWIVRYHYNEIIIISIYLSITQSKTSNIYQSKWSLATFCRVREDMVVVLYWNLALSAIVMLLETLWEAWKDRKWPLVPTKHDNVLANRVFCLWRCKWYVCVSRNPRWADRYWRTPVSILSPCYHHVMHRVFS